MAPLDFQIMVDGEVIHTMSNEADPALPAGQPQLPPIEQQIAVSDWLYRTRTVNSEAVLAGETMEMVVPDSDWYYAMVDSIDSAMNDSQIICMSCILDCIPLTYFESMAPWFAEFYPRDVDSRPGPSYYYVYRTDNAINSAEELRSLGPKNDEHRRRVDTLLQEQQKKRFRLVWLELPIDFMAHLRPEQWLIVSLGDDVRVGLACDYFLHTDNIAEAQDFDQKLKQASIRDILFIDQDEGAGKRLARVISLDFVPEFDFGQFANRTGSSAPPSKRNLDDEGGGAAAAPDDDTMDSGGEAVVPGDATMDDAGGTTPDDSMIGQEDGMDTSSTPNDDQTVPDTDSSPPPPSKKPRKGE